MSEIDLVRCPACRGMKQVPKLGGMLGDCNQCLGKGKIKACDKVAIKTVEIEPVNEIKQAVARAIPFRKEDEPKKDESPKPQDIKIDGKKAVFKKKKA